MKQETLEEVALKFFQHESKNPPYAIITPKAKVEGFIAGAEWRQERMYSEEDMKQFGLYLGDNLKKLKGKTIDEIFEQFKNL
jgi:hypothetical protein